MWIANEDGHVHGKLMLCLSYLGMLLACHIPIHCQENIGNIGQNFAETSMSQFSSSQTRQLFLGSSWIHFQVIPIR